MTDNQEIIPAPKTIDEEFTRTNRPLNAKGLTDDQVRRRDYETAKMMEMFPKLNPLWADMIWNFCELNPDEAKRVMETKEWEGKPTIDRNFTGGTIPNAFQVLDKSEVE